MKRIHLLLIFIIPLFLQCRQTAPAETINLPGLDAPVEILVDRYGIPHIYADTEKDLFFAQGYYACMDRLFQFEVWRMQATGTVAKVLGEKELNRDIGTRLFKFRGDLDAEMNHYHPRGKMIIESYTAGVNAYIDKVLADNSLLPIEFKLLDILPEQWTPEVVISRHQGLLGNIGAELSVGRQVAAIGEAATRKINWFHPNKPDLTLDKRLTKEILDQDILGLYTAYRRAIRFTPEDINEASLTYSTEAEIFNDLIEDPMEIGSNNWIVSGDRMANGHALMANDPHRRIAVPSLRYMAHLVGPGWNVIGGGEPEIPGISIGHNGIGAWGLTVHRTDAEDLYFYETNPDNPNQYRHKGEWLDMTIITESIPVKDKADYTAILKYTIHGPVVFEDTEHDLAFAVRCGWQEVGGAPYLASLRMDQAKTFEEFRDACNYSNIPGENMIWADKDNNIGWQAVGIAPIRNTHSGMVPVPGDGNFEWEGYLEIKKRPNLFNPEVGYFATSNQNVTDPSFEHMNTHAYQWSDPYRGERSKEVFDAKEKLTFEEMVALQTDYKSMSSNHLLPKLAIHTFEDGQLQRLADDLKNWDQVLNKDSRAAGIYAMWESTLRKNVSDIMIPSPAKTYISQIQLKRVIDFVNDPESWGFPGGTDAMNALVKSSFEEAVENLHDRLGDDTGVWTYGDDDFKHILMRHPLSTALSDELKSKFEVGPLPRGGNAYTLGSSGGGWNQPSGASFKVVINTGDWDSSVAMNSPGQAGDPDDTHYKDLFELWANDKYFPLYYSREKVEAATTERILLKPMK